jgi:hypothetical protein
MHLSVNSGVWDIDLNWKQRFDPKNGSLNHKECILKKCDIHFYAFPTLDLNDVPMI